MPITILFVIPDYENIWENLGIAYVSAYIKKNYQGELNIRCLHQRFTKTEKIIGAGVRCDIVAFTATTPTYQKAVAIAKEIKKRNPSVKTILGGYHATSSNNIDKCFGQIVKGEGEIAFLDILNGDFRRIVFPKRTIQWNELPFPDRDLVYNDRMVGLAAKICGERITSFQSRRVCPFHCKMCSEKLMTGLFDPIWNPTRIRPAKDTMDEIELVSKKYRLTMFKFVDAEFNTDENSVIEFCQEKIKRGNEMRWQCMVHAGLMTEDMMLWMAKANCIQIDVGVESGSQKVLNYIGKGVSVEKIINVFEWAKKYGIKTRAFTILGMPIETKDDIYATDRLIQRIKPDVFGMTILCPYPGSDLYDEKFKDIDWSRADEYSNDFWSTPYFTNQELKSWQRYFARKYNKQLNWHQRQYAKGK